MGNYENLKQSITEVIRTNGNQEITGAVLQSTLLTIISTVGANATFAGIATPTTNPGTPDGPVFYLASENGTYSNFGGVELQDGLSVLMWNGSWSSQQVFGVDDEPTAGSDNLVKSGGIYSIKYENGIKGPKTKLSQFNYQLDANRVIANANTNNLKIKWFCFFALKEDTISYGIVTPGSYSEVGTTNCKYGWNLVELDNTINTDNNTYFGLKSTTPYTLVCYWQGSGATSPTVGAYQAAGITYKEVGFEVQCFAFNEDCSDYLFKNIFDSINDTISINDRINSNLPSLSSEYLLPSTPLTQITRYDNSASYIRGNNISPSIHTPIFGIYIYVFTAITNGNYFEVAILNIDTKVVESVICKYYPTVVGYQSILFELPVYLTSNQRIVLQGEAASCVKVQEVGAGAVGMVELSGSTYRLYPGWEIAFGLITSYGLNLIYTINDLQNKFKSFVDLKYGEIIIPSQIEIAKSRQCNLWWDCIANYRIGDPSVYFETKCTIGQNLERGFRIDATNIAVGTYTLQIVSRRTDTREIISNKTTTIKIVDDNSGSGSKQILMIGDSRTWQDLSGNQGSVTPNPVSTGNKRITATVKNLLDNNLGATFTFLGSFVSSIDATVKNLAQSGATYDWAIGQIGNSITNYIVNVCGGTGLDYCTIMYGINDIENWADNNIGQYSNSVAKIETTINYAKSLVDLILAGYPNCKILMVVEPTTCGNQDGFGTWDAQTAADQHLEIEFAQKVLRKKLLETFDNAQYSANVLISSGGIWCDRLYGFPYRSVQQSVRTPEKMIESWYNSVHPHNDGYEQIADGIYSTIKYLESL